MKILHVINSFHGGGAEKLVLQLHGQSLQNKVDSYALSLMSASAEGLPNTYSLELDSPYRIQVLLKLYAFLRQSQWKDLDIIHVHLFPAQLIVPVICWLMGLKVVLITTEHSTSNKRRNSILGKSIDQIIYSFYKKIVCISFGASETLHQWLPKLVDKLIVIYNGIRLSDYSEESALSHSKKPIIISVGRLVEVKNYETAIHSLNLLDHYDFEYWIVGSGPLEAELKDLTSSLSLLSKVKFLGFCDDVRFLLKQASVFLLPSLHEGFGLAVVEAMASGLPVVVSNIPGLREVVSGELRPAFLVNPRSSNEIADALKELLDNPTLCESMGNDARQQATQFDIEQSVNKHLALYKELLEI